jgi:hypothetical protein
MALATNFVKVQMAQSREPNQIVDLQIGAISDSGLRECAVLPILQ